jgi:hypothetical protein
MKRPSLLLNAAAALALSLGSVQAVVLSPTGDASGTLTFSGTNVTKRLHKSVNGTSGALNISKTRNAMIRFEVVGAEVSAGAVREARLTLYFSSVTKAGDIQVHLINQAWDETFPGTGSRTMPTFDAPFTIIPASSVKKGQFVVMDVTTEVKAWMTTGNNFGFAFSSADNVVNAVISAKEGTGTGYAPQLELVTRAVITPGTHNTGAGVLTMASITIGQFNTAFGKQSMVALSGGSANTATGYQALENNINGNGNTANGYVALKNGTTGSFNTALGSSALANNTADHNTAVGYRALLGHPSASNGGNVAVGSEALTESYGMDNVGIGVNALKANANGGHNTAVGYRALSTNIGGTFNTAIGKDAGPTSPYLDDTIAIGAGAQVTQSSMIRLGGEFITLFRCKVGLTVTSDRNEKENFLPVDGAEVLEKIKGMPMTSWNYIGHDAKTQRHYGPMAQDFYEAFGTDSMGTIGSPTTVNTNDMAGVTFSALQQLAKENEDLKEKNAENERQLQSLSEQIQKLSARLDGSID